MDTSPAEESQFKQTQAEILTREIDINEFIPELRQLRTDNKSITGAINYLHGQYQTAILNANTAQRVAYDAKAVVDEFMINPPKDGKSAYEIANSLRPEGSKFKSEIEWINNIEELKGESLRNTLRHVKVFAEASSLTVTIDPPDWMRCENEDDGYTYTIIDDAIKKNQEIELISCDTENRALFKILAQAVCDSISDGEMTLHIPKCREPEFSVTLGFKLKEYILKEEKE